MLRKLDYITTKYDKGRYLVYPGFGMHKGKKLLDALSSITREKEGREAEEKEPTNLRIVR